MWRWNLFRNAPNDALVETVTARMQYTMNMKVRLSQELVQDNRAIKLAQGP
jgi:hypothetical protein